MDSLNGRRVLVTGGLGALGQEIVAVLGDAGSRVAVNDIVDEPAPDALTGNGYVVGDATNNAAAVVDHAVTVLGALPDVVCCHAGVVRSAPILEYSLEDLEYAWRVNVLAAFALAQAVSRSWVRAQLSGHLIFTGSWVQDVPWPGIAAYSSSKAALRATAKSFARELAPHGIRANVVAPGIVAAGMARRQWETEPDYRRRAGRAIPLGALQPARSVADMVAFLCSDRAGYATGATFLVDGGASLYPLDDDEIA